MARFAHTDHTPFAYEPQPRSGRALDDRRPASDRDSAMRLLRSGANPHDRILSDLARSWCDRFAAGQQPRLLCAQYPRIANRLALCWSDKVLTEMLFKDLLVDRRGSRKGFPTDVHAELAALAVINGARVAHAA